MYIYARLEVARMARQATQVNLSALPAALTTAQARQSGISRRVLDRLVSEGRLERLGRGVLLQPHLVGTTDVTLLEAAVRAHEATICLTSALAHHDLTDEIPTALDLALPRGRRQPSGPPLARWHTYDLATFGSGRMTLPLPTGLTIGIYGPERSIVDAFNPRFLLGRDVAVEALRRWLRRRGSQPTQLLELANPWPHARAPLDQTLQVLL